MELLQAAKNIVKALEADSRHAGLDLAYQELRAAINEVEPSEPAVTHDESGAVESISKPLPSAEDLDAVDEESKVKDITSKPKKAWGK